MGVVDVTFLQSLSLLKQSLMSYNHFLSIDMLAQVLTEVKKKNKEDGFTTLLLEQISDHIHIVIAVWLLVYPKDGQRIENQSNRQSP